MASGREEGTGRPPRVVTNLYGRPWEEFDSVRAQALIAGAFTLESESGVPLCGRQVDGEVPVRYVAQGWK